MRDGAGTGWEIRSDFEPQVFFAIPSPDQLLPNWSTMNEWASHVARVALAEQKVDTRLVDAYSDALLKVADLSAAGDGEGTPIWALLHAPTGDLHILLVEIYLWDDEGIREDLMDDALRLLAVAEEDTLVEEPVVNVIHNQRLGRGIRALRYVTHPDPKRCDQLMAQVRYIFHTADLESFIEIRSALSTPTRVLRAIDDLDDLARGVEIVMDED